MVSQLQTSHLIWWLPIITLLAFMLPIHGLAYNIYMAAGIYIVPFCAAFLAIVLYAQKQWHFGIIFSLIFLIYIPIYNLSCFNILEHKSHLLAVILNFVAALVFLYHWRIFKLKK